MHNEKCKTVTIVLYSCSTRIYHVYQTCQYIFLYYLIKVMTITGLLIENPALQQPLLQLQILLFSNMVILRLDIYIVHTETLKLIIIHHVP